jgi:membrane-associated phospholipid phosphatase
MPVATCPAEGESGACDPGALNALDRSVVGKSSKGWRLVSDGAALGAYALPVMLGALDYAVSGESEWGGELWKDLLVASEAVGLTVLVTDLFKYAVRRPRPTRYDSRVFSNSFEHSLGFPSGHTSSAAAAAAAGISTFFFRHPESPTRYGLLGLGAVITGLTACGRVGGGMHFYSDVLAGAVLGTTLGVLVPYLHRTSRVGVSLGAPAGGAARSLTVSFSY